MLFFKEDLVSLAKSIIDARGNSDDEKAFNYLKEINYVFNNYYQPNICSPEYVRNLDYRIRNDYPIIYDLERMPSNQTTQQENVTGKGLPPEINKLNVDMYGIFYTVLLKKGEISALKDFLKQL